MGPKSIAKRPSLRDGLVLAVALALGYWVFHPGFLGRERPVDPLGNSLDFLGIFARFVVFLAACGLLGSLIAGWRGGSRFGGFVLGMMLGPLGLIMATSLGPRHTRKVGPEPGGTKP